MKLHEYQAKKILKTFGIKVPESIIASKMEETVYAAKKMFKKTKKYICVIKAQINAGGRGKVGGIKIAKSIKDVYKKASNIIGKKLVTNQTNKKGKMVKKVIISEEVYTTGKNKEYYLSIFSDRNRSKNILIYSKEGGIEIESKKKSVLFKKIDPYIGIQEFQMRKIAFHLKMKDSALMNFKLFIKKFYNAYIASDAYLLEINPLLITKKNEILAIDAKGILDENAIFRHLDYKSMDWDDLDSIELEAKKAGLNFLKLDGEVACMVNGAGLAMATMDMIKLTGANPANFLDLGGQADFERIKTGLDLILKDKKVKLIFINIFGGIVRCDIVAEGILKFFEKKKNINFPIILRLEGTNVKLAKKKLKKINCFYVSSLEEAAIKIKVLLLKH
ncbi:ADP-forming succinate--CoA ligase subunit beta [Candidatus Sulcia muelleri]|uniref:ADP-forming succinate--CoA ligase subunit beta n=1 Tax=Candidatus Karelsulcia muelleri TaxID=336810 RepID=UPI000BD0468B|nr:ADP-forming succinate--CoA ligase subunit beta [Candidatus Karelsulcia muelleri]NHU72396.1 ADP-forming succinate--CoA ligase subunit beta [Candidatus Karelsulcia muelleri]